MLLSLWRFLFSSNGSLTQKAVRGGLWVFALKTTAAGLGIVRTLVLARFLQPSDFGLISIALLSMSTLEAFTQTGFDLALIQKREQIKSYLDSVWSVQVLRGCFLFLILFLSAPSLAKFFNEPQVILLVRVVSISQLFKGGINVGIVYFLKELEFKKKFIYQASGLLTDFVVSLFVCLIWRNVWALVFGFLAGSFVNLVVSFRIHSYRPCLRFDWKKARGLFNFGKYVSCHSVILYLLGQADHIFVGKVLGITALGFYQLAQKLVNVSIIEFTQAISEVTFPAYSKLQDEKERLKRALLRTLKVICLITIPLSVTFFILAPQFTKLFLGENWLPMVSVLQILSVFGLMCSIIIVLRSVFYALAKVNVVLKINVIQFLVLAVIIYPLAMRWGISGVALAVSLSGIVNLFLTIKKIRTIFKFNSLLSRGKMDAGGSV